MLDFHKIINTEEKRRGVEALGAEMIGKLSYYERWIVAFANILFQKGILTPERAGAEDGRGRGALARRSAGALGPQRRHDTRRPDDLTERLSGQGDDGSAGGRGRRRAA